MKRRRWRSERKAAIIMALFSGIASIAIFLYSQKPEIKTDPALFLIKGERKTPIRPGAAKAAFEKTVEDEERIPIKPGAVKGAFEKMVVSEGSYVECYGWAFDEKNSQVPTDILLTYDGKDIFWGRLNQDRPDIAKRYGKDALKSGFKIFIPFKTLTDKKLKSSMVRLFVVSNGVASELNRLEGLKIENLENRESKSAKPGAVQGYIEKVVEGEEKIPIKPGAVKGAFEKMVVSEGSYVECYGWAFDEKNSQVPTDILLTYDGKDIFRGRLNQHRPDIAKRYGQDALKSGFKFKIPLSWLKTKELHSSKVGLYAVSNGVASELNRLKGLRIGLGETREVKPSTVLGGFGRTIVREGSRVEFHGWAFYKKASQVPEAILVFDDGKNIAKGEINLRRPDVAKRLGNNALESGFTVVVPLERFKDKELNGSKVSLFTVLNGVESELNRGKRFEIWQKIGEAK